MNGQVSRPEEISPIILLIIISIVRPFVPRSFVWGLAIVQLVLLVRAIPRHDWNTVHLGILLCSLTLFSVLPGTRRWPWIFLMAVGSAVSLLLWFKLARPDVTWQAGLIPTWSPGRLVLLGLGFALFNAAVEEMIWRGVVFHALERTGLPTVPVVLMQAVSFGVVHLHGFPSGSLGILLASAYGAILGVLRWQTRGLLVPFVAHAVTDLSIFEILIYLAHD